MTLIDEKNKILNNFKKNLNLNSFKSYLDSLYYISDEYIIYSLIENYSNDEIDIIYEKIKEEIPLYSNTDSLIYFIHLKNNNDSFKSSLDENEIEYLLDYLDSNPDIELDYYLNIINNLDIKYENRIKQILLKANKNKINLFPPSNIKIDNSFYLFLYLMNKNSSVLHFFDYYRFSLKCNKKNKVYKLLSDNGFEEYINQIDEYLISNNYISLYKLLNQIKLNESIISKITSILLANDDNIEINKINNTSKKNLDSKALKNGLDLAYDLFKNYLDKNIDFDLIIKDINPELLKIYLLKLKEIYKGYNLYYQSNNSLELFNEKEILKLLYNLLLLNKKRNIELTNTKKAIIVDEIKNTSLSNKAKSIPKENNKNININNKSSNSNEKISEAKDNFKKPIIVLNLNESNKAKYSLEEKYQSKISNISKIKGKAIDEIEYEIYKESLLQYQIFFLLILDGNYFEHDFNLLEIASKLLNKEKQDNLIEINNNYNSFKKEIINHKEIFNKNNILKLKEDFNKYNNEINQLKEAYSKIERLEEIHNESFIEKKANICNEIFNLQMKEINLLMNSVINIEANKIDIDSLNQISYSKNNNVKESKNK